MKFCITSIFLAFSITASADPVPLFDGKTFTGWDGDTAKTWRIENGEIIAGSPDAKHPRTEFLCSTRNCSDFDLRLEYRRGENNGGIQFRSERVPNQHEVSGYQADFAPGVDGCLYDESRRNRYLAVFGVADVDLASEAGRPGALIKRALDSKEENAKKLGIAEWNRCRIRAEGPRIRLWINDVLTVDYTEKDASIPRTGKIAIQIHGGATEIRYRNITIEELDAQPSPAPADHNAVNTTDRPDTMMEDSPVDFAKHGGLMPAKYPADVKERGEPAEKDYLIFSTPCRSLSQIATIQKDMPPGQFTTPPADWTHLRRTRRILTEGGDLRLLALGDSIVNDTMRSGWVAQLQAAYTKARIDARVFVRGGGGCQHYREDGRVEKYILPWKPDLVYIGGISQKSIESIGEVIRQLRAGLPDVEILLASGAFGSTDPRDPVALANAPHSGTGAYGQALKELAAHQRCAYLDMTTPWVEYIQSAKLHPHLFYRDPVHANEFGEQILAKIMMAFWTAPDQPTSHFGEANGKGIGPNKM